MKDKIPNYDNIQKLRYDKDLPESMDDRVR